MILSDREVFERAWDQLLYDAESMWEDWIDEDGEFTEEDFRRVLDAYEFLLRFLRDFKSNIVQAIFDYRAVTTDDYDSEVL